MKIIKEENAIDISNIEIISLSKNLSKLKETK